ncbi:TetR/AcrR family transcriptional regulator [Fodinicola acaciae]|uniref:TetR/AcrR family transcriptional regulator n=1 Tax=Fodinicola acaciae TaxID=2681555 RepID=UPI0013D673CC|nr:TetR/AcrR family transcriptional regulator [Fodinicola acaciae]
MSTRLPRTERREQILAAATTAFARNGYGATSLDDVATEAGVSRVILYRHFDSKNDLYRAVLDRAQTRLSEAVGEGNYSAASIPALVRAAADNPDGFRLLFHYAAREPEFRDFATAFTADSVAVARRELVSWIGDDRWTDWAARLVTVVAVESVIAWLDAGQPDPDTAADRVSKAIGGVIAAARLSQ